MVVIDPPFIMKDCWRQYGVTSNFLLRTPPCDIPDKKIASTNPSAAAIAAGIAGTTGTTEEQSNANFSVHDVVDGNVELGGRVLLTTVHENCELLYELFKAKPNIFRPKIPNLVYQ